MTTTIGQPVVKAGGMHEKKSRAQEIPAWFLGTAQPRFWRNAHCSAVTCWNSLLLSSLKSNAIN